MFSTFRRRVLQTLSLVPALASRAAWSQPAPLTPTPQDTEGPYYPIEWSNDIDFDLTSFRGKTYVRGTPMEIVGVVRATNGAAIANATVEIWQTDEIGKYRHPGDDGEGPATRGFQGFGRTTSDSEGRYRFLTIKPVIYGGRPAHVHFRVKASAHKTLTTQMYFAGENKEGGAGGFFGGFSKERDKLTVSPQQVRAGERALLRAQFELVLAVG